MKLRDAIGSLALGLAVGTLGACRDDEGTVAADDGAAEAGTEGDSGDATGTTGEPTEEDGVHYLTPSEHLVRISMALRGARPSRAELEAVEADPEALGDVVDQYLDSPRFGATVRDLHNDSLLTLADYFIYPAGFPSVGPLEGIDPYHVNRSITEAPLRLIEHVVMEDLPYTDIVTADYTLANGVTAAVWGLPYDGDGESWEPSQWTDGRGNAGILSDSWLFQRHSSTESNANRGRANAISRALLCYDFLSRDIEVDASINLADPNQVADAVLTNPACASCHQGLDPLASFFSGYYPVYVPTDIDYPFTAWVENLFPDYLGVTMRDPTYFGQAGSSLVDLGHFIAEDPRFSMCAVKRFYAYFHQTEIEEVPLETAAALQAEFLDSGMNAKALTKAIVLSDAFRMSHADEDAEIEVRGLKKARPTQLGQLVESITGFAWKTDLSEYELGKVDLMADSFLGYQVLGGGIDSVFVTRPSHTYSASSSLVLQNLAREAAHAVVEADFAKADKSNRKLFTLVDENDLAEALLREQVAELHLKVYGEIVSPDSETVEETLGLFVAAMQHGGDARRAWKLTLTAMLQDLAVAYY